MTAGRLASGGRIDRKTPLAFAFDGRKLLGHPGDTLASALLANGIDLVGRSFKYHRRRGIVGFGVEEPNALVTLGRGARAEPNTRATMVELHDGLDARSQNRWPSLGLDLMAVNGLASRFLAAGFYYKTFMWPPKVWTGFYEKLIRHAAGLGRASFAPDPDSYEKTHAFADILIVGAGPSGLVAALVAGRAGARVILADEMPAMGGRLRHEATLIDGAPATGWIDALQAELRSLPKVRLLPRTTVFGAYDHGTFGAVERVTDHLPDAARGHQPRQRYWQIQARATIIATGAIERGIALPGNDLPGVMLASAARAYLHEHAVVAGQRPVIFTNNPTGYATALELTRAGIEVQAVVDPGPRLDNPTVLELHEAGVPFYWQSRIERVLGRRRVTGVVMRDDVGGVRDIACDHLLLGGGWSPTLHLTAQKGLRPHWDEKLQAFVPPDAAGDLTVVGAAAGRFELEHCLADGANDAVDLARRLGFTARTPSLPILGEEEPYTVTPFVAVPGPKAFVDLQNDVTVADMAQAAREGYRGVEHAKRYTTHGMATDQGKSTGLVGQAVLAELVGRPIGELGTPGFRPPYTPVALGALAHHHKGADFAPLRRTPLHEVQAKRGAVFFDTGLWQRARYFPQGREDMAQASRREVESVRSAVGIADVTPLGKIELFGPDALTLIERLYCNGFSTLAPGRARYGLMLREDGMVMDDGTVWRLGPDHFMLTTTTANAAPVMSHIELHHQYFWPELDMAYASVSEQWAGLAVAGPRSRDLLQKLVEAPDISDGAFPFMAVAEGRILGVVCRIARISFSGECAFEVYVPAGFAADLYERLMRAGEGMGVVPYGLEAMGTMRIEKGHVAGPELDGRTTPADLGLGRMQSRKKPHVGSALRDREGLLDPERPQLVGLKPVDAAARLRAGAHLVPEAADAIQANAQGHVTSIAFSPALGSPIALGLLARGAARHGQRVDAVFPLRKERVTVEVCPPCFVDPAGERLRG
jgi:heterotetrameric sarcosine oxidase alpha subunit